MRKQVKTSKVRASGKRFSWKLSMKRRPTRRSTVPAGCGGCK